MSPVAKVSFPTALFLGMAVLLTVADAFPVGATAFAYLGGIQILNTTASRFSISRAVHWTHAMTFEIFALLGVALLRFFPTRPKPVLGKGKPILLVHGYMNNGSVWLLQKKRLEALGLGPIYTINLGYPFRSIRTFAEKVKEKADAIAQETGSKELVLIGHSMGGLVCSWYATQLAEPNSVTDLITIASPLSGTYLAHIALGPNAREMEPDSPFIQELQLSIANSPIRFYHIATKSDQLVIPSSSAIVSQNPHFIYEDIGHASLLYSKRVTEKIAQWLR